MKLNQIWDQVESQNLELSIFAQLEDLVPENLLWDRIWMDRTVSKIVRNQVIDQVGDQVMSQVNQVWEQVWEQIESDIWERSSASRISSLSSDLFSSPTFSP
jgi:hypothetical protein